MKAIILGAGKGSRLQPLTSYINKILLPLYDRPILSHVLEQVHQLDITEVALIVREVERDWFEQKKNALVDKLPLSLTIIADDTWATKGMAGAVYVAKDFVGTDTFVVIPGDNAFTGDLSKTIKPFKSGALVHRTHVDDPTRYGVGIFQDDKLVDMIEKPANPPSNWALVSPHVFDHRAFAIIENLQPSARGEYEITDLCREYLKKGQLQSPELDGELFDVGTFDSLLAAQNYFSNK